LKPRFEYVGVVLQIRDGQIRDPRYLH